IPALFMTAVVSAYLFVAPETLGLSRPVSYVLALAVTAVCAFFFLRWRSRLAPAPATDAPAAVRQDSAR
ncbi:MAG: carbon starvation protein A, partial [Oxalobacter sp.]|nr:carbon starvation protein A [Oxalobacter sp.]